MRKGGKARTGEGRVVRKRVKKSKRKWRKRGRRNKERRKVRKRIIKWKTEARDNKVEIKELRGKTQKRRMRQKG